MAPKLSAVLLTKNEQSIIRDCLESLKWADEIVVVDDFSQDDTLNICREYTDRIYSRKLEDFGEQRRFSVEQATGDWVLSLDADEIVTPRLKDEIIERINRSEYDCFKIRRKTFYLGRPIRFCGWDVAVVRLFKKGAFAFVPRKVHEYGIVSGRTGQLRGELLHYSYRSISQHIDKINLYSRLEAEQVFSEGMRLRGLKKPLYLFVKPLMHFFHKYILLAGFLDGREGLLISFFTGIGYFFIYAKVWELQRAEADERK